MGGCDWIADAQCTAVDLLGAALQRPPAEALAVLQTVPDGAWQCSETLAEYAHDIQTALRAGIHLPEHVERFPDGDPKALETSARKLTSLHGAFTVATRTLPREVPEPDPVLVPADFRGWQLEARRTVPSVFREGMTCGTLSVLAGEGGAGKSYLALELALSIATGRGLVDGFNPEKRGRAICCFGEDDMLVISRRLSACVEVLDVTPEEIDEALEDSRLQIFCGSSAALLEFAPGGGCTRTQAFTELRARCAVERPRLVVIDPLVSWANLPDENSNSLMQHAADAFTDLAKASRGGVLVLHHASKDSQKAGDLSQGAARGASSLLCAARWVAGLRCLSQKDVKLLDVPEDDLTLYAELHVSKNSYAPRPTGKRYLERKPGGALVAVDLRSCKSERIAEAIGAVIDATGAVLTRREVCRGTGGLAVSFREQLERNLGFMPSQRELGAALTAGVAEGVFHEIPAARTGAGATRLVIVRKGVRGDLSL